MADFLIHLPFTIRFANGGSARHEKQGAACGKDERPAYGSKMGGTFAGTHTDASIPREKPLMQKSTYTVWKRRFLTRESLTPSEL